MPATVLTTDTAPAVDERPARHLAESIPRPRHESGKHIPIPPDHRSEQARRHSEQEQAAIDIAAGW